MFSLISDGYRTTTIARWPPHCPAEMIDSETSIDSLRRKIDELDDAIHDLLMRRAELAVRVGELKRRGGETKIFLRAGREAKVMRHVLNRHRGPMTKSSLLRIWREIIAATLHIEGPLAIAVCAPVRADTRPGPWDLARDYFGSSAPITALASSREVLDAVMDGRAHVGIVQMPHAGESEPWWPDLVALDEGRPRVIARMPFLAARDGAPEPVLALAKTAFEPSGEDLSLIALETPTGARPDKLGDAWRKAGLSAEWLSGWQGEASDATQWHLFQVDGFLEAGDARLGALTEGAGEAIARSVPLGGFAAPHRSDDE